jgi:hypothetical protein
MRPTRHRPRPRLPNQGFRDVPNGVKQPGPKVSSPNKFKLAFLLYIQLTEFEHAIKGGQNTVVFKFLVDIFGIRNMLSDAED